MSGSKSAEERAKKLAANLIEDAEINYALNIVLWTRLIAHEIDAAVAAAVEANKTDIVALACIGAVRTWPGGISDYVKWLAGAIRARTQPPKEVEDG